MRPTRNFDDQNFDKLNAGFIGETLREKFSRENFDKSLVIHQTFLLSNFCTTRYILQYIYILHNICIFTDILTEQFHIV